MASRKKPATASSESSKGRAMTALNKRRIYGMILSAFGIFFLVALFSEATGVVGGFLSGFFKGLFGPGAFLVPLLPLYIGILMILKKSHRKTVVRGWSALLILIFSSALFHGSLFTGSASENMVKILYTEGQALTSGGVIGGSVQAFLLYLFGGTGSLIILWAGIIILLFIEAGTAPFKKLASVFKSRKANAKKWEDELEADIARDKEAIAAKKMEENKERLKIDIPIPDPILKDAKEEPKKASKEEGEEAAPVQKAQAEEPSKKGFGFSLFNKKAQGKEIAQELTETVSDVNDQKEETQEKATDKPLPEELPAEPSPAEPSPVEPAPAEPSAGEIDIKIPAAAQAATKYTYPPLTLLKKNLDLKNYDVSSELKSTAQKLEETLLSFGVKATVTNVSQGPSVTRYELQPAPGVKVSRIVSLSDDIALNLASAGVRIEAPIPGKAAVGIEVANVNVSTVLLRDILESKEFKQSQSKIAAALGKDISGNPILADLAKMPHMLIAGATGSGKSVCVNTLLMSILFKATPEEVRLILVDPKVVELKVYNGIPHLLIPVVTDPKKAAGALNWAVSEMLKRYQLFAEANVRDLGGYNEYLKSTGEERMPQIVIVIDELSDLMMAAPRDVEDAICRLAQMARAAGMHLVIATQRPSVDVITGTIKANIPSRISFAVSSQIDSRTILDMGGAEKLLGRGDMLFYPTGLPKPIRVQGCFVSDGEVEAAVDFVKSSQVTEYNEAVMNHIEKTAESMGSSSGSSSSSGDNDDEMLDPAIDVVIEAGQASVSLLQRRLKLGYARAARLVDEMETRGIVGPYEGSKPRPVLISRAQYLEMKLSGKEEKDESLSATQL